MPLFYNISADNPEGIKVLDNPTKTLKALAFPIEALPDFAKRDEAYQAGVYILYNTADKNERPNIYIGQSGKDILSRIQRHKRHKNFWNYALVFVEKGDFFNLNMSHAKIIESKLLEKAKEHGVVVLDNNTGSIAPRVLVSDEYAANVWAEEIIIMTKLLGLPFFTKQYSAEETTTKTNSTKEKQTAKLKSKKVKTEKPESFCFVKESPDAEGYRHSFSRWRNLEKTVCEKIIERYGEKQFLDYVMDDKNKKFHTKKKNQFGYMPELMTNYCECNAGGTEFCINTNNSMETILRILKVLIEKFPEAEFKLEYKGG